MWYKGWKGFGWYHTSMRIEPRLCEGMNCKHLQLLNERKDNESMIKVCMNGIFYLMSVQGMGSKWILCYVRIMKGFGNIVGLIDRTVFYAAFNSISVISWRQLTLFMLSWVSPVLGWALKCLAQWHSHEKTQRIQCGSNPGPLDYESNTLPLSHVGLWHIVGKEANVAHQ